MSRLPAPYRSGRIRKCGGPRHGYVDGATLQRVPLPGGDVLRPPLLPTGSATDIFVEPDVTVANVRLTPSAVLLRCRARNIRARYVRLWTAYVGTKIQPFKFTYEEMEGGRSAHVRVTNLMAFIQTHELRIETLERDIPHNPGAEKRLKKASRGGGEIQRLVKLKDDAVLLEITLRKRTNELVPPDLDNTERSDVDSDEDNSVPSAPFSENTPRQLYPAAYKDDVGQINREMDMEETGVKKLSKNDKWLLARASALAKGDMAIVDSFDKTKDIRLAAGRRKRANNKKREKELQKYIENTYGNNATE